MSINCSGFEMGVIVLILVFEAWIGKTKKTEASSTLELILLALKRVLKKE